MYIRSSLIHSNLATKIMQTQLCHLHSWSSEKLSHSSEVSVASKTSSTTGCLSSRAFGLSWHLQDRSSGFQKVYSWWGMSSKKMALKSTGIFFPKQIIYEWSHAVLHGVQLIWVIPNVGLQGWSRGTTVCEHLESDSFQHYPTSSTCHVRFIEGWHTYM